LTAEWRLRLAVSYRSSPSPSLDTQPSWLDEAGALHRLTQAADPLPDAGRIEGQARAVMGRARRMCCAARSPLGVSGLYSTVKPISSTGTGGQFPLQTVFAMLIPSIHQPVAAWLSSDPIRHFSWTVWPEAAGGMFTTVLM